MNIFSFGNLNISYLFPIIAPLFCIMESVSMAYVKLEYRIYIIPILFFVFLGMLFAGIIMGISTCFVFGIDSKLKKTEEKKNLMKKFTLVQNKPNIFIQYLTMVLIGVAYYIVLLYLYQCCIKLPYTLTKDLAILFQVLLGTILCKTILLYDYHKHNFFAFILMIISFVILLSIDIPSFLCSLSVIYLFLYLGTYVAFTLLEFSEKWLMEKRLVRPYQLLITEGLVGIAISILLFSILSFIQCTGKDKFMFIQFCDTDYYLGPILSFDLLKIILQNTNPIIFIIFLIASVGFYGFEKSTNFYLTPIHRCVSDIISCIFSYIVIEKFIIKKEISTWKYLIGIFAYIIMLFASLVYNEFILCNFWGLNDNTRNEIFKRVLKEDQLIKNDVKEGRVRLLEEQENEN